MSTGAWKDITLPENKYRCLLLTNLQGECEPVDCNINQTSSTRDQDLFDYIQSIAQSEHKAKAFTCNQCKAAIEQNRGRRLVTSVFDDCAGLRSESYMDGDDFTVCPDGEGRLEPNGWKNKGDMWCYTNGKKRCIKPI